MLFDPKVRPRGVRLRRLTIAICASAMLLGLPVRAAEPTATDPAAEPEDTETLKGVEVEGAYTTAGAENLYQEEKRASAAVTEALSAEQIARTGDSDAATALKRVTGLSLVDGKYVYVRGLGERYSSATLNGSSLPSPDPSRRVVPLDLFPTDVLEGIVVQKSYSADMPGEFGGGNVALRTKGVPGKYFLRLTGTLGYTDGTSFEDGLRYDGGDRDWTGYDDGTRELPDSLAGATANGQVLRPQTPFNPDGFTPQQFEQFGEDLAGNYDIERERIGPNTGLAGAIGNGYKFGEYRFGYIAALRYADAWNSTQDTRRTFAIAGADELVLARQIEREKTERNVDLSGFLNLGFDIGNAHHFKATTLLARQTSDQASIAEGFDESPDDLSRFYRLEWIENELFSQQFSGDHSFPALHGLGVVWDYTVAQATREAPNVRDYRYDRQASGIYQFSRRSDSNSTVFNALDDDQNELNLRAVLPFDFDDGSLLELKAGGARIDRERDSTTRRFEFTSVGPAAFDPAILRNPSLDAILNPANIGPNGFQLRESTRGTDNYTAEQNLNALYLAADYSFRDKFRANLGVRREANDQQVRTFDLSTPDVVPVIAGIDETDLLPAAALTWLIDEQAQLRFGYGETLSRPDFRELSPAPFTDPLLDIETIGNPDLETAHIDNYDLRYEYYFSPVESISAALFWKEFERPIERVLVPGTGDLLSYANAAAATNWGIELDAVKYLDFVGDGWENVFVGANYSWIESEIELGPGNLIQTNDVRPLQGQSPYVLNIQVGYQSLDGSREATLAFNTFGKRISQVGSFGAPDIYEQPFEQLDFLYRHELTPRWILKFRLGNLLDPEVQYRQGDEVTREFRKGREVAVSLEWRPGA